MPKRSRSGVVSRPVRVVAPTSVNGGRSSVSVRAAGPWPDDDVEPEVLERRVEDLLDRPVQPVDLVHEQHVARLEPGEDRGEVALALERRPGDAADADAELLADDVGEARLAEAGRARRAARGRAPRRAPVAAVERDRELLLDALLADELVERPRPQGCSTSSSSGSIAGARNCAGAAPVLMRPP